MGTINDDPILRNVEAAEYLGVSPSWLAATRMNSQRSDLRPRDRAEGRLPQVRARRLHRGAHQRTVPAGHAQAAEVSIMALSCNDIAEDEVQRAPQPRTMD